jgi:hypothetical protein
MTDDYANAGMAMTAEIMMAVGPIIDDQPSDMVIQAFAGAMMAVLVAATESVPDQRVILRRYADRIIGFAAAL